jgi:hypothetical protein
LHELFSLNPIFFSIVGRRFKQKRASLVICADKTAESFRGRVKKNAAG